MTDFQHFICADIEMRPVRTGRSFPFEVYQVDMVNQCLWRKKHRVLFDPKAFVVLRCLIEYAGQLVTKEELLDMAWPDGTVCEAVIKFQIQRIRATLNDNPRTPRFIETVHRRGYRFIGRLKVAQPRAAENGGLPHRASSLLTTGQAHTDDSLSSQF